MISRYLVVAAGASLAILCGGAYADEQAIKENWKKLDANADGRLTMAENRALADDAFKKVDVDKDGTVTQDEFKTAIEDEQKR